MLWPRAVARKDEFRSGVSVLTRQVDDTDHQHTPDAPTSASAGAVAGKWCFGRASHPAARCRHEHGHGTRGPCYLGACRFPQNSLTAFIHRLASVVT